MTDIALIGSRLAVANANGMVALWDPDTTVLVDDFVDDEDCE